MSFGKSNSKGSTTQQSQQQSQQQASQTAAQNIAQLQSQSGNQSTAQNTTQNTAQNTTQNTAQNTAQASAQAGASNSSYTPTNLAALKLGWGLAGDLFGGTTPQSSELLNAGQGLTGAGGIAGTNAAIDALTRAGAISNGGAANSADKYLTPFANGSMNGSNPALDAVLGQFARSAQAATDGDFAASGRYGSGANAAAFNSAVANKAGDLSYQNYNDAQNRQLQAGQQLSANNANSTNAALQALGLVAPLTSAATGAGGAVMGAGYSPLSTYAQIINALGQGGGTTAETNAATGNTTANTTGNTTANTTGNSTANTISDVLSQMFGANVGNQQASQNSSASASGSASGSGTSKSSTSSFNFDLAKLFNPIDIFTGGIFTP